MRPLLPRDFKYLGWHTPVDNFEVTSITVTVDSDTSVSVEWWLSAPGTGQLEYGLTTAYGSATAVESSYLTYHFQTITGLTPGTTYNVRAKSVSESAVTVYSEDHEVTTTGSSVSTAGPRPAPAVPTGPAVKVIGTDTAAVDDTGASDVTAALNTILANLNAGDVLVFAQGDPEGDTAGVDAPISEYRVSGALELPHVSDVVLWGYGTKIRQYGIDALFQIKSSNRDRLTLAGFELEGTLGSYARTTSIYSAPGGEGNHGIEMARPTHDWVIEDCYIHHMVGDGIYHPAWPTWDWRGVGPSTVRYCRIEDNKRQGISPNCGHWHIHHNVMGHQGGFNIDLEDGKTSDFVVPSSSMLVEDNEFWETGWASAAGVGLRPWHINLTWGSNDPDGPPNRIPCGPYVIRNNTIKGLVANTGDGALIARLPRTAAYNSSWWTDYTRIDNPDARGYAMAIEDNVMDLPADEQNSSRYLTIMRSADGVYVDGNTLQSTTVDVPTSGYGANTDVSGSDA